LKVSRSINKLQFDCVFLEAHSDCPVCLLKEFGVKNSKSERIGIDRRVVKRSKGGESHQEVITSLYISTYTISDRLDLITPPFLPRTYPDRSLPHTLDLRSILIFKLSHATQSHLLRSSFRNSPESFPKIMNLETPFKPQMDKDWIDYLASK
jgi:hypothetical protein